ncbi:MAG: adenylosuccinate synthase [Candidatus Methanomethylophilaceae archaeon]|nr:adenylosuccinate synthase [Candidatus Methanomethylophilaceae archaeon]
MPTLAIIGAQWGDEGKGKITDYLDEDADIIARFQGGNNAGHTIVVGDSVFKLHLLPSGVVRPGKLAVIGNGVVVNLEEMEDEIRQVLASGGSVDGLRISDRAHLIINYHKKLDGAEEIYRGNKSVGTTKKGIGPAYQDKIARSGFRVSDLFDGENLKEKIAANLPLKKDLMEMLGAEECQCTVESLYEKMTGWRRMIEGHVCDCSVLLNEALDEGRRVLFEGAQGAMLDIDHGTYPYVTSSATCGGGICTGTGVAPGRIEKVVGCLKAYTTRVGEGPFVTELFGEEAAEMQKKGGEFGVTTGRGRRCGWLDLVVAEHAKRMCGFTSLAITKLDVLNGYPEVRVCTAYRIDGEVVNHFPADLGRLCRAEPVYETLPGWGGWEDTEEIASQGYDALPENMRSYIRFIEDRLGVPADIVSIGPKRSETIDRKKDWWN